LIFHPEQSEGSNHILESVPLTEVNGNEFELRFQGGWGLGG